MKSPKNKYGKELKPFFIELPVDVVEKLDKKASESGVTKTVLIKLIISDFFKRGKGGLIL